MAAVFCKLFHRQIIHYLAQKKSLVCIIEHISVNYLANTHVIVSFFNFLHCSPMGVFEMAKFEAGTKGLMDAVVEATKAGKTTIIGKKSINIVQKDTRNMSVVFST